MRLAYLARIHPFEFGDSEPVHLDGSKGVVTLTLAMQRRGVLPVALVHHMTQAEVTLRMALPGASPLESVRPWRRADRLAPGAVVFVPEAAGQLCEAALLLADQGTDKPWQVERLFWTNDMRHLARHSEHQDPSKGWATAWSIYCKYVAGKGDRHCHRSRRSYLTG